MRFSKIIAAVLLTVGGIGAAVAGPTYTYVGSWIVDSGPLWYANVDGNYTTPIYSGVEAAATIFGGSASDYVTSTVGADIATIDFNAWYDGYGQGATIFSDTFHADPAGSGLYAIPQTSPDFVPTWSAWVADHNVENVNYAFRVTNDVPVDVPEPESLALFAVALAGLLAARSKTRKT